MITGKIVLKHGDRLVIGGNHYFKVLNPYDECYNVKHSTQAIDFEFAHQEILRIQEEKYVSLIRTVRCKISRTVNFLESRCSCLYKNIYIIALEITIANFFA